MAIYHLKPTTGNDANDGLSPSTAKKTLSAIQSVVANFDKILIYKEVDAVVLTAAFSFGSVSVNVESATSDFPEITGAYPITIGVSTIKFKNIFFKNGSNYAIFPQSSSGRFVIQDCKFDQVGTGAGWIGGALNSMCAVYNTSFKNSEATSQVSIQVPSGSSFINCSFDTIPKPASPPYNINNARFGLFGDLFIEVIGCTFKNIPTIVYSTSAITDFSNFKYNTFDGSNARGPGADGYFFTYRSTTTVTTPGAIRLNNNIFYRMEAMLNSPLAGTYSFDNFFIKDNWISATTDLTNYSSLSGDITTETDPKFYSDSKTNYRIEANSSAAIGMNGLEESMGAFELEEPEVFYSSLPLDKVENGYSFRDKSRTNNRTGTLVGGGETDPKKVLTTSSLIVGQYIPVSESNVRQGISVGADGLTGTIVVPVAGDVRAGVSVDATTGVLNLPAQADVKEGVTYDNATKTGTLHLYVTDNILASDLKIGVTKTVKDVSITGTYDGSDRFDVPAESDVREGVDFVDNTVPKTGTLHLEETDAITADELKIGVTKTVKDVSLTGTYDGSDRFDVPDEADVREGVEYIDNLENKTGILLLPQTDDIMASDMRVGVTKIVKDVSITGTYDGSDRFQVPSEDEVLDGVEFVDNTVEKTGNVVLPLEADVREGVEFGPNNSLTGEAGVDKPSIDPGEGNVLKGVEYEIDGVPKVGQYDTGEGDITPGENNIRIKVLKMIENKLYGIDPAKSAKYQNVVRSVSYEPIVKNGLTQDDYPHVQIAAEENQYDHAFVLSGNMPLVTMRVRFIITTPGNWTALDAESLYEDIRQCFIRDNFTLEGLVILTKVEGFMPLATDADKQDQNRKGQLTMFFKFIETIE